MKPIFVILACLAAVCSAASLPAQYRRCELFPLTRANGQGQAPTNTGRNFWTNPYAKWPQGRVPFVISDAYSSADQLIILGAIAEWESKTCVRFIPKSDSDSDYVEITPEDGTESYCYSYVGRIGGRQRMKMFGECLRSAAMIHELGHAIGFNHEHQRPDRDDFVNVYLENVDPLYHYAFDKYNWEEVTTLGTPYDYSSVMQYPFHAFTGAHDPTRPAMTLKDGSIEQIEFEAEFLSQVDILKTHAYFDNCA